MTEETWDKVALTVCFTILAFSVGCICFAIFIL